MTLMLSKKRIFQCILVGVFVVMMVPIVFVTSNLSVTKAYAAARYGLPTDPNIVSIGRWDTSSRIVHTSYWPGAYLTTVFTGATIKIKLGAPVNIYVSVDHGPYIFYANASGTVNITPVGLASGTHSLQVATSSTADTIQFEGFILDSGAKTVAPKMVSQLIEFVGDSITAGATDSKQALSASGWLIGEQLAVRHTQIAQPGICLVDGVKCGSPSGATANSIGMSRQFFKLQPPSFLNAPDWNFSRYQATMVVVNLGTNDNHYSINNATFQATYITFLQNIRTKYPNARLLVIRPFNGSKAAYVLAAFQAVKAAGDTNVQYVDTTGWLVASDLNGSVHPSDAGQIKVANKLGPIIASVLKLSWKNL